MSAPRRPRRKRTRRELDRIAMSNLIWRFVYLHGTHSSTWARLKQYRGWSAIPEVDRLRKVSTSFAQGHEGLAGYVKAARGLIRARARALAKLRARSADVIPLQPNRPPATTE